MKKSNAKRAFFLLAGCVLLSACASTGTPIATPALELTSVKLQNADFARQTFLLGISVSNPNAFALPVKAINYRVFFDNQPVAGGETSAGFTVPAHGDEVFRVSVDLDLLGSAAKLSSLFKNGVPEHMKYRLEGTLAVNMPFTRPLPFSTSGVISVQP